MHVSICSNANKRNKCEVNSIILATFVTLTPVQIVHTEVIFITNHMSVILFYFILKKMNVENALNFLEIMDDTMKIKLETEFP